MAQTKRKTPAKTTKKSTPAKKTATRSAPANRSPERTEAYWRAGIGVVLLFLGVASGIGYFNSNGVFIKLLCDTIKGLVGFGFWFTPPLLIIAGIFVLFVRNRPIVLRTVCALLLPIVFGGLIHLLICRNSYSGSGYLSAMWKDGVALASGGAIGGGLSQLLTYLFSRVGGFILFFIFLVLLVLAVCDMTVVSIFRAFRDRARARREREDTDDGYGYEPEPELPSEPEPEVSPRAGLRRRRPIDIPLDGDEPAPAVPTAESSGLFNRKPGVITPGEAITGAAAAPAPEPVPEPEPEPEPAPAEVVDVPLNIPFMEPEPAPAAVKAAPETDDGEFTVPEDAEDAPPAYVFPPLDLLSVNKGGKTDGTEEARVNSERLEAAFKSFGVNVHITNYTRGPTVTRYEAELEAGIKLSRLTSLADDIALSLGASGVRIAAMPNKISTVGIEVPNKLVSSVLLRDIIDTPEFRNSASPLTFAIGKNIGGDAIVGNVSKLPHLLVAGTTGSGKSVCLNALIISILYKSTPEEVRFIMIDPKMVEFRIYNGIPHLLVPVVTDVKKAAGALQWAVVEMMKRYRLFSEAGARDIDGYNELMRESGEAPTLPRITVVIDELADLMLQAAKEVEESICRVAQMGRAAGIHLIIATQSPRADVITGLMKANIPSRIALKVSSSLESRIILDAGGNADKLVGNGDMLYAPIGVGKPIRIQGAWVSDAEREKVVNFIKEGSEARYDERVISEMDEVTRDDKNKPSDTSAQDSQKNDYDELLPQAVDVIFESGQASVSMLQRRLKLGYSRAARIVDQMEEIGVVGPFEGSKPRQLLITRQQWQEMQYVNGTAPIEAPLPPETPAPETSDTQ
ncbi:MAG: DNA translocase FtsK [Oscillospiraceae bacterium]|nr:DNA translocase FtsK [Oscillospiraceae bacterium]